MLLHHRLFIALLVFVLCPNSGQAQANFAILEKNFNFRASDLFHELNDSKDSLIIGGKERIKYIYSINERYKREIFTYVGKDFIKLPLNKLSLGKHVMVVNHKSQLIVFVLKIFNGDPSLLAISDEELAMEK